MQFIRTLIREDRLLVATIFAIALCMKLFVPAGYMIGEGAGALTISICSPATTLDGQTVSVDIGAPTGHGEQKSVKHPPCAFTALAMASLAGADAPLLAIALAFILLTAFRPVGATCIARRAFLLPPSRGPPQTS